MGKLQKTDSAINIFVNILPFIKSNWAALKTALSGGGIMTILAIFEKLPLTAIVLAAMFGAIGLMTLKEKFGKKDKKIDEELGFQNTYIILQFSSLDKQNPNSEPLILIDEDIKNILTHKVFRDSANELLISIEFKKVPKNNNRTTNIISLNNNPQVAIQCLHGGKYMYFGKIYGNLDNKNGRYKIEWSWQQND